MGFFKQMGRKALCCPQCRPTVCAPCCTTISPAPAIQSDSVSASKSKFGLIGFINPNTRWLNGVMHKIYDALRTQTECTASIEDLFWHEHYAIDGSYYYDSNGVFIGINGVPGGSFYHAIRTFDRTTCSGFSYPTNTTEFDGAVEDANTPPCYDHLVLGGGTPPLTPEASGPVCTIVSDTYRKCECTSNLTWDNAWGNAETWVSNNFGEITRSNEYTTAALIANTVAALPAYDNDWNDTAGSFRNLILTELSYSIRQAQIRIAHKASNTGYLKVWIDQVFTPLSGPTVTTPVAPYIWTGTGDETGTLFSPSFEIPIPSTNGTNTYVIKKWSQDPDYEPDITLTPPEPNGCPPIRGCMNFMSPNYNPNANYDDGSCITPVPGCTDPLALNYNPLANYNNGSCTYPVPVYGCTDPLALNYDPEATDDDGSCYYVPPVYGCTDPIAENYNPEANTEDWSCEYIYGCMDPGALNYDPAVTADDGSCEYIFGCTDPEALNYNPEATIEDGSCEYE